jgi:uncharacterized protein (DUF433 family)
MSTSPPLPFEISDQPLPLRTDVDGVVRVGTSRVMLETVVASFQNGATPEQIADDYPSLRLSDIYAVVSFVLDHPVEIERYLAARRRQADQTRQHVQPIVAASGIRDRLLARGSAQRDRDDAQSGG